MDDTGKPQRRKFQFSLRKLMLWTVVVASYFGIFGLLEVHPVVSAILAAWVAVVGSLRITFGGRLACILSVVAGAVYFGCAGYVIASPSHIGSIEFFFLALMALGGTVIGLILFGALEGALRFVNWADNLMRTQSDQFSVRRLTLWMVVVAIYLGILGMLKVNPAVFAMWFVLAGILRLQFDRKVSCLLSGHAGLGYGSCVYLFGTLPPIGLSDSVLVFILAFGGSVLGLLLVAFVEVTFRFVDWADHLLQTKDTETPL
jgi:hypothetical protein